MPSFKSVPSQVAGVTRPQRWVHGEETLTSDYTLEFPGQTLVVSANLTSKYKIDLKAGSLVVLGGTIHTTDQLSITVTDDLFVAGEVEGDKGVVLEVPEKARIHTAPFDSEEVETIRRLGIDILLGDGGTFKIPNIPGIKFASSSEPAPAHDDATHGGAPQV